MDTSKSLRRQCVAVLCLIIAVVSIGGPKSRKSPRPLSAPRSLTAVAESGTAVRLSWNQPGANHTGFTIYRGAKADRKKLKAIAATDADVLTYVDNTVSPATKYFYAVSAYKGQKSSTLSGIAKVTTPIVEVVPFPDPNPATPDEPSNPEETPPTFPPMPGPLPTPTEPQPAPPEPPPAEPPPPLVELNPILLPLSANIDWTTRVQTSATPVFAADKYNIVRLADGRFLYAGAAPTSNGEDFAVVRTSANGTLDTTFGNGGITTTNIFSYAASPTSLRYSLDVPRALFVQADNRIVLIGSAAASANRYIGIARFLENGEPDLSFGGTGKTIDDLGGHTYVDPLRALALPDGRLVTIGKATSSTQSRFFFARYAADLSERDALVFDPVALPERYVVKDAVVQPDGKVIIAADRDGKHLGEIVPLLLYRLNADGTADGSFGTGGVVSISAAPRDIFLKFTVSALSDGFVVAGDTATLVSKPSTPPNHISGVFLYKFDYQGKPVTDFGSGGRAVVDVVTLFDPTTYYTGNGLSLSVSEDAQHRLLLFGSWSSTTGHHYVVRLTPNGRIENQGMNSIGMPIALSGDTPIRVIASGKDLYSFVTRFYPIYDSQGRQIGSEANRLTLIKLTLPN